MTHPKPGTLAAQRKAQADAFAQSMKPHIESCIEAGAVTLREIAAALNERGIPTPTGQGYWLAVQVQRIQARWPFPPSDLSAAKLDELFAFIEGVYRRAAVGPRYGPRGYEEALDTLQATAKTYSTRSDHDPERLKAMLAFIEEYKADLNKPIVPPPWEVPR